MGEYTPSPETIAAHLAELDKRARLYQSRYDYMYGSSARIIRYLLARDAALAAAVGTAAVGDHTGAATSSTPS